MNASKQTRAVNMLPNNKSTSRSKKRQTGINLTAAYTALIQGYERMHRPKHKAQSQVSVTKGVKQHE